MGRKTHSGWVALSPPFTDKDSALPVFRKYAKRLVRWLKADSPSADDERLLFEGVHQLAERVDHGAALKAALLVLSDIARQRWSIRVRVSGTVEVKKPSTERLDPKSEKDRVRTQELIKRDEQLRQPATRKFVKSMERRSVHDGHFVSIFSLMRDGRELAHALESARNEPAERRIEALQEVIDPYLVFVDERAACPHTGLRLQDIWRYFRHTWTNQYTSIPGRSMAFLVRDRAREFHPVVGIGALGSPIVQIRERDAWIGWHPDDFLEFVEEHPSAELATWLAKITDLAIDDLHQEDFVEESLIAPKELRAPTRDTIARLTEYGEQQRELHHRLARSQDLKRTPPKGAAGGTAQHWRERALTHLYKSKRALTLADMLSARKVLGASLEGAATVDDLHNLVQSRDGRRTIRKILRKAKADRVGIAMADITVCGAVAPYNPILGGKLVSMLAASPEVVSAYREKYAEQESEIASSMAGRPIVRPSELVFLGTTSLYGVGSSQYNRLRMPTSDLGGLEGEELRFLELGRSEAYGTSHFSTDTVDSLVALVQQASNGQRVNSIFGEGVSPKLRKIREGLDALNFPADVLLQHGRHRIVYGVPVVRNLREYLLGMDDSPDYVFDTDAPREGTVAVARWWIGRWLSMRFMKDEVLAKVAEHTLVRPVRHGARVVLPPLEEDQRSLFEDID